MEDILKKLCGDDYKLYYIFEDRCVAYFNNNIIKILKNKNLYEKEIKALNFLEKEKFKYSPRIIKYDKINNYYYIIKTYINGETLEKIFLKLTNKEINIIFKELKQILNEIHNIKYPEEIKLPYEYYIYDIDFETYPELLKYKNIIKKITYNEKIVFTHGDFHPRNIIIKDKHVEGIIDWEFAGNRQKSSEGSTERFHITPGLELFNNFYYNDNYKPEILSIEHVIYCLNHDKYQKAIDILNLLEKNFKN